MRKITMLLIPLLAWLTGSAQLHLTGDTLFVNSGAVLYVNTGLSATDSAQLSLEDSLHLTGNLTLDSGVAVSGNAQGFLNLKGSSPQLIDAGGVPIPQLKLSNPAGAALASEARVGSTLLFKEGRLDIQNHHLTIGAPGADSGTVSGATVASYVQTSGNGELKRFVNGNTKFPVGNGTYSPAFAHLQNPDDLGIRTEDTLYQSYSPKGAPETENAVNRAWYVGKGAGYNQLQLTTFWQQPQELPGFDRDSSFIRYFDPGSQRFLGPNVAAPAAAGSGFYSQEGAGFAEFNTWYAVQGQEAAPTPMTCDTVRLVSGASWVQSTVVAPSSYSGSWSGVNGSLPDSSTFAAPVMTGQPYSFQTIFPVDSARVIKAGNNVTFFKKTIYLDSLVGINAEFFSTMDDQMELYINGQLVAGQYVSNYRNGRLPGYGAQFNSDSTVVNGAAGSKAYGYLTPEKMDRVFRPGGNELVYVLRNFAKPSDAGGFSFSLEVNGCRGMVPPPDTTALPADSLALSLVSDSGWEKSTTVEASNYSGDWQGATSVPAVPTFALPAVEGQPYSFHSIDAVDSAKVIKTESNIHFYRQEFELTGHTGLDARFRMTGDDGFEIYVNRQLVARENNSGPANYRSPSHDIQYTSGQNPVNGPNGGDLYDVVAATDLDNVFVTGTNEVVVAIRNKGKANDLGGFSFRMDLEKNGSPVIVKKETAPTTGRTDGFVLFPNPTSSQIAVKLLQPGLATAGVYDFSGKLLLAHTFTSVTKLDLGPFSAGVYLVRVNRGNATFIKKVVKQ